MVEESSHDSDSGAGVKKSMEGAFCGKQGSQCVQESDVVAIVFLL